MEKKSGQAVRERENNSAANYSISRFGYLRYSERLSINFSAEFNDSRPSD